ncbi:MAG TPA: class I SAM-dependent methyltransferase [Methanomassiliicoccales archaeon]|nr:class I SAM-dependent methyltransferase [Methanomassiliicoccales archaeon]
MTREEDPLMDINKKRWNEKVDANLKSPIYDVDGFLSGASSLLPIEVREVGDVAGKDLLHLQCHFGMDSISWAGEGARVTGVDFSPEAIKKARELSAEIGIPATFIESNIYDLERNLEGQFDIIFTSYGAICWLPDLDDWARLIVKYLRPGGFFYIVDIHPFGNIIDENCREHFKAGYPYFSKNPLMFDDDVPIIDSGHEFKNKRRYEWMHPVSEIINALVDEGLIIDFMHEFPCCFFPMHPAMELREDGYWYLPEKDFNVPMLFSLKASKM